MLFFGVMAATDVMAGEVGRGTSDMLFSHPVRRSSAVLAAVLATALHLLCMGVVMTAGFQALTALPGLGMGPDEPTLARLLPAVGNVTAGSFAISLTCLLPGALCSTRLAAVAWSLLLVVPPILLDFMGVFSPFFAEAARVFPEHYYRPHVLLVGAPGPSSIECLGALAALGGGALLLALFCAARRDLQ
jgi:ABC-type transport system involved in multi-copper enzyme maturation permease subunit